MQAADGAQACIGLGMQDVAGAQAGIGMQDVDGAQAGIGMQDVVRGADAENVGTDEVGWTLVNGNKVRKNRNLGSVSCNLDVATGIRDIRNQVQGLDTGVGQEIYVAGDSIVRKQGRAIQEKLGLGVRDVRFNCLPGGKIDHVSNAVEDSGASKSIVISVGTNDIGKTGYVSITKKYTNLFEKLKEKKAESIIIVGILPRLHERASWSSKAIGVNVWLKQQCVLYDFSFLDLWDTMYANKYYFNRDGVHLNFQGKSFFTQVISNKLRGLKRNFLGRI